MKKSLVDRIADGEATLLGAEEICKRIGVSRTTFDRWVRNGGGRLEGKGTFLSSSGIGDLAPPFGEGNIKFPPPDIRIGNSPRWELDTFKTWLKAQM